MDYDADGILDFISGSYDPGDVYLFKGEGRGAYAAGRPIKDEDGVNMVHHPVEFGQYAALKEKKAFKHDNDSHIQLMIKSFGSWPAMVDWDGDGDLDMLIGTFGGRLFRRENIGTREQPVFSRKSHVVNADGKAMRVGGHLSPVAADWNGDGKWDLIAGAADGSVVWFPNVGKADAPAFGAPRTLVTANKGVIHHKFLIQNLSPDAPSVPGARAQICVVDYNLDGHLDLLVGDLSKIVRKRILDEEGKRAFAEQQAKMRAALKARTKAMNERAKDRKDPDLRKRYQEAAAAYSAESKKLDRFYHKKGDASYVWLYLRKPNAPMNAVK